MTTSTPRTTTFVRCLLASALVAFLLLTAAPARRAEASQGGLDVDTVALQMAVCRLVGGTASSEEFRTVGSGLMSMKVTCLGGLGGNWGCDNSFVWDMTWCSWWAFEAPTGGQADHTATGGVLAEEPADDAIVAPVLVDEVVAEPVVEDEPVVDEPSIPTPEPTPPANEEADNSPEDEPAGHDLSDEVAPDELVVDAPVDDPVVDPVVVDPLVDPALVDAEVEAEPAVDEDSFEGE